MLSSVRHKIEQAERYLSQREIARRLDVHHRTVRKWKAGQRKPSKPKLTKLGRMLGGLKVRGHLKTIYRRRRINKERKVDVIYSEHTHKMNERVECETRYEVIAELERKLIIAFTPHLKKMEKVYKRMYKEIKVTKSRYYNALNLLLTFDYYAIDKDGHHERKINDTSPSDGLTQHSTERDIFDLGRDIINNLLKLATYKKYIDFRFKHLQIISYRYRDIP